MPDAHDPHWSPEFTGDTSFGDVGSGNGFGIDLYQLYRAGRIELPDTADRYSELTVLVDQTAGPAHYLFSQGEHQPSYPLLLSLRARLQRVFRSSCLHISEAGQALVEIADSYAATDEAASSALAAEMDRDRSDFEEPHVVPDPPAPRLARPGLEPRGVLPAVDWSEYRASAPTNP